MNERGGGEPLMIDFVWVWSTCFVEIGVRFGDVVPVSSRPMVNVIVGEL